MFVCIVEVLEFGFGYECEFEYFVDGVVYVGGEVDYVCGMCVVVCD